MSNIVLFLINNKNFFNLTSDIVHKYSRFSQTFYEKNLKFIQNKKKGPVIFGPGIMLLLAKDNFFT